MGSDVKLSSETQLNLAIDAKTDAEIQDLAGEIGGSVADVFAWSLALLRLAVDSKKQGKHLVVIGDDGKIETEVTGL